MSYLLPWNPINLIDGESHWIFWEITYLITALVISKFLGTVLSHLEKKLSKPSFTIFSESLYKPFITLIWYLAALYTIDLVTDELLSQGKPKLWTVLINGGIVITLGWFLLRLKNRCISYTIQTRTQEGKIADAHSMQTLSKLFTVVIGIVILILLNDFTGMNLTTLLAFGGVGGLALAFASQEIVSNFFGGFMIHMTRPFLIGEELALPSLNLSGVVEEIGWYQTRIRPQSKEAVYIPNSLFSKALLINKTRITHRLFNETLYIKIQPLPDIEAIIKDINAYLGSHPQFERTEGTGARIESIGSSVSIVLYGLTRITIWHEFYRVRGDTLLQISNIIAARGGSLTNPPNTIDS